MEDPLEKAKTGDGARELCDDVCMMKGKEAAFVVRLMIAGARLRRRDMDGPQYLPSPQEK